MVSTVVLTIFISFFVASTISTIPSTLVNYHGDAVLADLLTSMMNIDRLRRATAGTWRRIAKLASDG